MRERPIDIVADTSAILAVLLEEPARAAILRATAGARLLAAPSLPWEVGNALVALLRRRRLDARQVTQAWRSFERVPLRYVDVDVPASLLLAATHGVYAYDAYVLEAARSVPAALLTLDRRMAAVARDTGVVLVEVDA